MKYKTLADLIAAYQSGELTPETAKLYLDNDYAVVTFHAADDPDWERAEDVFRGDPHDLFLEALKLLGVPYEYA